MKGKYKDWVNVSNLAKPRSMDRSDVAEWQPINSDILSTSDHEAYYLSQRNAATENVATNTTTKNKLSNPAANEFVFSEPQITEIEKDETVVVHEVNKQNRQNLTNGNILVFMPKLET